MRISETALKADGLLVLTAVIWGFAFSAQRSGMENIGPFAFNAVRFGVGALSVLPLLLFARRRSRTAGPSGGPRLRPAQKLSLIHI